LLGPKRSQNLPDRSSPNVDIDVQSGIRIAIAQGTLPWQPILGAKSAEIGDTPSFLGLAFHNGWQDGKADGRIKLTPLILSLQWIKIW